MKVKVSKTMAKMLNDKIKEYTITFASMSEHNYKMSVDIDIFNHDIDYDWINNRYNVIMIEYPCEYYACNNYLTTKDLTKAFDKSDKTLDGFIQAVKNMIEV